MGRTDSLAVLPGRDDAGEVICWARGFWNDNAWLGHYLCDNGCGRVSAGVVGSDDVK